MSATDTKKCWRCLGDGFYYRVPDGVNPFYAGAMQVAQISEKVRCLECAGTAGGERPLSDKGERT